MELSIYAWATWRGTLCVMGTHKNGSGVGILGTLQFGDNYAGLLSAPHQCGVQNAWVTRRGIVYIINASQGREWNHNIRTGGVSLAPFTNPMHSRQRCVSICRVNETGHTEWLQGAKQIVNHSRLHLS